MESPVKEKSESMGYKDKAKALYTLHCLEGRDISYQHRVVKHYHTSAKKILIITKQEEKRKNIGEAIEILENWLRDYTENNRGKTNLSYLPIETIEAFKPLAEQHGILDTDFYEVYKKNDGAYKSLRTVKTSDGMTTWDIERNIRLKVIINNIKSMNLEWYETEDEAKKGYPSKEHIRCILLGYSPDAAKVKTLGAKISKTFPSSEKIEKMEVDEEKNNAPTERKVLKRNRERSPNIDSDENKERAKRVPRKQSEPPEKKKEEEEEEERNGLSFKDKARALKSIKSLEGRDVLYQYHAVNGLMKSATKVISNTKDEEKIKNMQAAIEVFENWITDYNVTHRGNENFGYLTLEILEAYKPVAETYDLKIPNFLRAYEYVGGDYKKLRSVRVPDKNITWDIERNNHLRRLVESMNNEKKLWFETEEPLRGLPSKEHMECILWGYSKEPTKLKKTLALVHEKLII